MMALKFLAFLNDARISISGGIYGVDADMEFNGRFSGSRADLESEILGHIRLNIKFSDEQIVDRYHVEYYEPHIGVIHLNEFEDENATKALTLSVHITLPSSMFPILQEMSNQIIKFDTVHEERQNSYGLCGIVKQVHFNSQTEIPFGSKRDSHL
jgi:hypothetical protein